MDTEMQNNTTTKPLKRNKMTAEELISSMGYGWKYETTESAARLVAEHAVEIMYSKEEVINEMFDTLKRNAVDNIATITNVDLFISSWKKELKNK